MDDFKRMMGASHPELIKTLWPQWFKDEDEEKEDKAVTGWSYEGTMTPEEAQKALEDLRQQKRLTLTSSQMEQEGWL